MRNIRALRTAGRGDQFVRLRLEVLGEMPAAATVVELLQRHGAHSGAQEEVWAVAVDATGIRSAACIARGDFHQVFVPLPALVSVPLLAGANRMILAHNHPTGRVLPSTHDFNLTEAVANALNSLGIILEDHLILAPDGRHASFAELKMLAVPDLDATPLRA